MISDKTAEPWSLLSNYFFTLFDQFSISICPRYFILVNYSSAGIWNASTHISDKSLQSSVRLLPPLIQGAWADSTNDKYCRGWKIWQEWCREHPDSPVRPAEPVFVALFINCLVLDCSTKGKLDTAFQV